MWWSPKAGVPCSAKLPEKRLHKTCTKCPALLTFAARRWAPSPNPERLLTDIAGHGR